MFCENKDMEVDFNKPRNKLILQILNLLIVLISFEIEYPLSSVFCVLLPLFVHQIWRSGVLEKFIINYPLWCRYKMSTCGIISK